LVTNAGVDHDYNFISRIERAKERFEKEVIIEKGLVGENEVKGPKRGAEDKRFEKVWYGDQLVHVPATRGGGAGWGRWNAAGGDVRARFDQNVRRRLRRHDIEVLTMPKGLSRQKENKTAWNRRTETINWQVEWFLIGTDLAVSEEGKPTRLCCKNLDKQPLYQALAAVMDTYQSESQKRKRALEDGEMLDDLQSPPHKKQKTLTTKQKAAKDVEAMVPYQESASSTWPGSEYTMQCSITSQWSLISSGSATPRSKAEEDSDLAKLRFFLLKPLATDGCQRGLIPVSPTDTLLNILAGRTIIEFPTLYVLGPDAPLPEGLPIVSTKPRNREADDESEDETNTTTSNREPWRQNRFSERKPKAGEDANPRNPNRAPLRNNRFSERKAATEEESKSRQPDRARFQNNRFPERKPRGGGPDRKPRGGGSVRQLQKRVEFAVPDDAEEGEINSEGEEVGIEFDTTDPSGGAIEEAGGDDNDSAGSLDEGAPEEEVSKPAGGLVDYGSSSDSE
jgi:hypothetical protein